MTEESQMLIEMTEESMMHSIDHLEKELHKVRAGKASPAMLDGVLVSNYGSMVPLNQVSTVTTPDPRTITLQPWDKNMLHEIEKAIMAANLGFNPQNDGILVRINVPILTEDRRKDLVKRAKAEAEHAKVGIRNVRRTANDDAKKLEKDGVSEDEVKDIQDKIQTITNKYIERVDKTLEAKEKDIMTV